MSQFEFIRQHAIDLRREVCGAESDALIPAEQLLSATQKFTGVKCLKLDKDDPLLAGSLAVFDEGRIYYDKTLPTQFAQMCLAHEFGHFRLHESSAHCTETEINLETSEDSDFSVETYVMGYSSKEKTEREANLFACEFIIPHELAKQLFFSEGLKASEIAAQAGISVDLVYSQLAYAMIAGKRKNKENLPKPKVTNVVFTGDETQLAAAQTDHSPILLEAAPGTGKTRTLIDRICYLLEERSVEPEKILALTFTNKAAAEMRERIAIAVDSETAGKIYISTFHSFGLDLLSQYHEKAGLHKDVPLIDQIAAIGLLEPELLSLRLDHYLYLREPLEKLGAILSTISRAKDEMVSAEKFAELSAIQLKQADNEEEIETAEKCVEIGRVYHAYEKILREKGMVDYGDLLFRSVELLKNDGAILAKIRGKYRHILVDEYQDVNRVSAELLRLMSDNGKGVWAVGDARQAIYRWRGAAPTRNISGFALDFPNAKKLYLGKNYRSRAEIVSAISKFADAVDGSDVDNGFTDWLANRNDRPGEIKYNVVLNTDEEAAMIAGQMLQAFESGTPWHEQALIARTHTILERFAERLDKHGIPIMYLGNWLESEVVRDLLSWLSLIGGDSYGLVRVGKFKEYGLIFEETQGIISHVIDNKTSVADSIAELGKDDALSSGKQKLVKDLIDKPKKAIIGQILHEFLFEKSSYLKDNDLTKIQSISIFQLLQLARSFDVKKDESEMSVDDAIKDFLAYVRRVKKFGNDQSLRQIPESAFDDDAVKLMTIHSAKGLEFEAVFIPQINKRTYPSARHAETAPLPSGIIDDNAAAEHEKEEKCLFFVAISRAKQTLFLSRVSMSGAIKSNVSEYLLALEDVLPIPSDSDITWSSGGIEVDKISKQENLADELPPQEYFLGTLKDYEKCPRRYFYKNRLKREEQISGIYNGFTDGVFAALKFYFEELTAGKIVGIETLKEKFLENWSFAEHSYNQLYINEANKLFEAIDARTISTDDRVYLKKSLSFELPNGRVTVKPDLYSEIALSDEKFYTAEKWLISKIPVKFHENEESQMILDAMRFISENVEVKVVSLKSGTEIVIEPRLSKGKETAVAIKYGKLIKSIDGLIRQDFEPNRTKTCPNCRFYFICSSDMP